MGIFSKKGAEIMKSYKTVIAMILIAMSFIFLRLYKLDQSLFFINDIGRDFFVLQQWEVSGKPPLLGPMTSALPINQSPIYFYLLFPFFLILQHSLFTTTIAVVFTHVAIFLVGTWFLKSHKKFLTIWFVTWLLITTNPQFVDQQRLVWNPSFVGIAIVSSFFAFLLWRSTKKVAWLVVHGLSLAAATAFSYSAAPVSIAFLLMYFFLLRNRQLFQAILIFVGSNLSVNLPLIVFELRHNFTFTTLLLRYEKLEQVDISLLSKMLYFRQVLLPNLTTIQIVLVFLVLIFALLLKQNSLKLRKEAWLTTLLFLFSMLVVLFVPVEIQAHYIFGVFTLFFILVACLPSWPRFILSSILICTWLNPNTVSSYFRLAPRSLVETTTCVQKACKQFPGEYFVSVQSAYHSYHVGPEFHYLLQENGCRTYSIYTHKEATNRMMVFADGSTYDHDKTAYDELTLFGPAKEIGEVTCSGGIKVHVLER
ncbi:MAG: hypothetical protein COU67_03350 [Candidatus Pacebacteria bacterium CG10_big_fil_rev_8_21_14_0_10_44_54]|nr:MAG: hypothetical protein COU67_03350 [Candidatus Pacebacteria bacterium CG10_big_fil_rev_8_21_14_0_10_44_54]